MIDERTRHVLLDLLGGAAVISAIVILISLPFHLLGIREVFLRSGWMLALEIVHVYFLTTIFVFLLVGSMQWLSYRTPIPPIVRHDD